MESIRLLSEKEFYNYLFNDYKPSPSEDLSEDERFSEGIYYCHICRTRSYYAYRQIASQMISGKTKVKVLDIGFYPGTMVKILKNLLGESVECYGAGLKVDPDFSREMSSFTECCVCNELDPFYKKTEDPIHLDFQDNSFDIVIATEILEHCISPLELIREGARILRKNGSFIITTPNVSHIGAVIKLLFGISNYERLDRSPMYLQNDEWRGHIRFYDKKELKTLFERNQLRLQTHCYYTEHGWSHAKRNVLQNLAFIVRKLFFCVPIYREGHFAIFRKD